MRTTCAATCVSRKPGAEIEAAHGQGSAEHGRRGNQLGGLPRRVHRDPGRTQGDRRDRAPQKMQYTGELGQYFRHQVRRARHCCARAASAQAAAPPSAASNSRRPMVTVIRPLPCEVRRENDTTARACCPVTARLAPRDRPPKTELSITPNQVRTKWTALCLWLERGRSHCIVSATSARFHSDD